MPSALAPYATFAPRWVRSQDGMLAGVCAGLGRSFGIEPWVLRLAWLLAMGLFGTGLLAYAILAWALPREDQVAASYGKRFLGVCALLSRRSGIEVGIVRSLALLAFICSLGTSLLIYLGLHLILPRDERRLVA